MAAGLLRELAHRFDARQPIGADAVVAQQCARQRLAQSETISARARELNCVCLSCQLDDFGKAKLCKADSFDYISCWLKRARTAQPISEWQRFLTGSRRCKGPRTRACCIERPTLAAISAEKIAETGAAYMVVADDRARDNVC